MNFCDEGGWTAGGRYFYPTDPVDHHRHGLPVVACSHLVCQRCSQTVGNTVDDGVRSYRCQCSSWRETSEHRLEEPDPWPGDPLLRWRCAGHPLAELPCVIDGMLLSGDHLEVVVRRSLGGWTPDGARPQDRGRATWPARLYARLAGTPWGDAVVQAVGDAAADPDPRVRGTALNFLWRIKHPLGHRRVLELLEGDRLLFTGVPDVVTDIEQDQTLEDSLWRAAHFVVGRLERARLLARAEALRPGRGREALYAALAFHDGEWFAEHAAEIARRNPATAGQVRAALARLQPAR